MGWKFAPVVLLDGYAGFIAVMDSITTASSPYYSLNTLPFAVVVVVIGAFLPIALMALEAPSVRITALRWGCRRGAGPSPRDVAAASAVDTVAATVARGGRECAGVLVGRKGARSGDAAAVFRSGGVPIRSAGCLRANGLAAEAGVLPVHAVVHRADRARRIYEWHVGLPADGLARAAIELGSVVRTCIW